MKIVLDLILKENYKTNILVFMFYILSVCLYHYAGIFMPA